MDQEEIRRTVERFAAWMQSHGVTQAEASRLCGVSGSTLSQTLGGKYRGNVGRVAASMARAMDRATRREKAPKKPRFAMTSIAEEVFAALETAHTEGVISLVQGESGLGKTEAARRYAQGEPETVVITVRPVRTHDRRAGVRAILLDVARAIGCAQHFGYSSTSGDVLDVLGKALRDTGRLIIVDEADYCSEGQLQALRMLHDESLCGIALLATPAMLEHLRARRSGTLQQVLNRIAYVVNLARATPDDVERILSPFGLDGPTVDAAIRGANGITRRLALGVVAAQRYANRNGGRITARTMARAYGQLMPVG